MIAAKWMSLPAVFGQRSPSLVYDTGTDIPADALFLEYHEESGAVVTVEVFPRADGSTFVIALKTMLQPFQRISVCLHERRNCKGEEQEARIGLR